MSEDTTNPPEGGTSTGATGTAEKTFTQAEVNSILANERRKLSERFADYEQLKAKAAEADASKSDLQKLADRVTAAETRAADAEAKQLRAEVAQAKGLTAAQAKRLSGATKEELEADADELLAAFGGAKGDEPKPGEGQDASADTGAGNDGGADEVPIFGRPKERLTPGAAPDTEPEKTPDQLADEVLKKVRGR